MAGNRSADLTGGAGFFALVCCVVPTLPFILGAAGLSGVPSFADRDVILLPLAAILLAIAGGIRWNSRRSH